MTLRLDAKSLSRTDTPPASSVFPSQHSCTSSVHVRRLLDNVSSNQRRLHGCLGRTEEPLHVSEFSAHRQGEDGR
ncbi:uncharacterized [Tachysurus ichikawai]